jgi:hypothetical protein
MRRLRWPRSQTIWPLLPGLLLTAACYGPAGPQSNDPAKAADQRQMIQHQANQHQVPFRDGEVGASADTGTGAAEDASLQADASLPFHDSQSLPAGTLLTVRLKNPVSTDNLSTDSLSTSNLSTKNPGAGNTFEAVVDKPIVIEGNTLVPRGASVAGRVESSRASAVESSRGYVRLTLNAIAFEGRDLPIQTASLYARAQAEATGHSQDPTRVVHLEKGRRLTFRLTEPAYVVSERPVPAR